MKLISQLSSYIGNRKFNADFGLCQQISPGGFLGIIADGVADNEITKDITQAFCKLLPEELSKAKLSATQLNNAVKIEKYFSIAIENTKRKVFHSLGDEHVRSVKFIFSAVLLSEFYSIIAHIGDCRVYFSSKGAAPQTKDHTLAETIDSEMPNETGLLLTRTMRKTRNTDIEFISREPIKFKEVLILATDGFWKVVGEKQMDKLLNFRGKFDQLNIIEKLDSDDNATLLTIFREQ
jgi:serine/threonine protein phosphatase PrpC